MVFSTDWNQNWRGTNRNVQYPGYDVPTQRNHEVWYQGMGYQNQEPVVLGAQEPGTMVLGTQEDGTVRQKG